MFTKQQYAVFNGGLGSYLQYLFHFLQDLQLKVVMMDIISQNLLEICTYLRI